MTKHVKACWGMAAFDAGLQLGSQDKTQKQVVKPMRKNGTITGAFTFITKPGKPSYSTMPHTQTEIW
jgi:hypothetical protein